MSRTLFLADRGAAPPGLQVTVDASVTVFIPDFFATAFRFPEKDIRPWEACFAEITRLTICVEGVAPFAPANTASVQLTAFDRPVTA